MKKIIKEIVKHKWIFILIVTIGVPIITNILMSYHAPWTKGGIGDWIPFYGSFAGGIITLIALFITLNHNESIQEQGRHDSVRPYIKAWHLNGAVDCNEYLKRLPAYDFVFDPLKKVFNKKVSYGKGNTDLFKIEIVVENIGQGSLIECKISMQYENNKICETDDIVYLGVGKAEIHRFVWNKNFTKVGKYKILFNYEDVLRKKFYQYMEFKIIEDKYGGLLMEKSPITSPQQEKI